MLQLTHRSCFPRKHAQQHHRSRKSSCWHLLPAAGRPGPSSSTDLSHTWLMELATGRLWDKAKEQLPVIPWQPPDLLRVMGTTTAAGALFTAANMALLSTQQPSGAPAADAVNASSSNTQLTASAVQHLSQEALLVVLFPAALWVALEGFRKQQQQPSASASTHRTEQQQQRRRPGSSTEPPTMTSQPNLLRPSSDPQSAAAAAAAAADSGSEKLQVVAAAAAPGSESSSHQATAALPENQRLLWCRIQWQGGAWLPQTLLVCAVVFPLADPLLSQAWTPIAEAAFGPQQPSSLVAQLHAATGQGQGGVVLLHLLASGLLGPAWEEMFWRGFFLTALTKVLPLPVCVAASAFNFATLHLSPYNWLPLLLLGASADVVYLRSGGNLAAPLLLHALWNSTQLLAIALAGKDSFV